jgi:hypothetical protein
MAQATYEKVCYRTEQQDEFVALRNIRTGEIGNSFGCTIEGTTIQVRLMNGVLDSWVWDDCVEVEETTH